MVWALEQDGLDPVDKLTLLGIANHADRFGGNAWPSVSTLAMYVGRSEMTVRRSLKRLTDAGLVTIVVQGGGSFARHGGYRPNLYTLTMRPLTDDRPAESRPHTGDTPGLSPVLGQASQGYVRRTVKEPSENRHTLVEAFEEWWKVYPKRVGKKAAHTAFQRAMAGDRTLTAERLIEGARRLAAQGREYRFIPNPTTWLNQGRWEDDEPGVPSAKVVESRPLCGTCENGWVFVVENGREVVSKCRCQS